MAQIRPPATSQRAGDRPIAFVIQNGDSFLTPVTLVIRPEELTKTEPSRTTVHQSLGRDAVIGWVDDFGAGMPTVSISGNTGWNIAKGSGKDGVQSFIELNDLITTEYHLLKQQAINLGNDPASVKLIFVDMLDEFTWSVSPVAFALQRSKSRPLLMRYNINLQAIDTSVETPLKIVSTAQNTKAGFNALQRAIEKLKGYTNDIRNWVAGAVGKIDGAFSTIAGYAKDFHDLSTAVFDVVNTAVNAGKDLVGAVVNNLIGIASDIAAVGVNLHRTLASIASIPSYLKSALANVANAFNEVRCIFKNSLKPAGTYEEFDDLNGASNCSSTTGGNAPSRFAGNNAFALMKPELSPITVSSSAGASMNAMSRCDPVLAPMTVNEMSRNLGNINDGVNVEQYKAAA